MKKILSSLTMLISAGVFNAASAQVCNANGNIIIFSNYDGGVLNIDVDVDIPNLKIGVVTYEATTINISGTYAANVVEVNYAGFNSSSGGCPMAPAATSINGAGTAITSIDFAPTATFTDPNGNPSIICAYQCTTTDNGGCNSPFQISAYYTSLFGGSIYAHETLYNCWSGTYSVSTMGNCCLIPVMPPVADFTVSSDSICATDCIDFSDLSYNTPDSWSWSFVGGIPSSSALQNPTVCFNAPGTYTATLEVTNTEGSSMITIPIVVTDTDAGVNVAGFTITADAAGANYQWLDCNNGYGVIAGETNASYTPATDGSYAVSVTMNGCTDTSDCSVILGLGLDVVNIPEFLVVYPNPSTGLITVDASKINWNDAVIRVTNVAGSILLTAPITNAKTPVNLTGFSTGIYFVSIETQNGTHIQKITLE